mgnify:FL=1
MASTFSSDLKLEIITTGEKAGQWGGITNTNLQILEQGSSGVEDIDLASGSVTLLLTDGATSNGKNAYLRLHGTLGGDRTITMPSGAGVTRVWVMKDDTVRGTSNRTLGVLTASGTTTQIPPGATVLCRSNGTETVMTILEKGYATITDANSPYAIVAGAQVFANTTANPIEIDLPASPAVGDEVTVIDTRGTFNSNNLTFDRNGQPINSGTSNLVLNTDGQAVTLVYVDSTRGWAFKTNTA